MRDWMFNNHPYEFGITTEQKEQMGNRMKEIQMNEQEDFATKN